MDLVKEYENAKRTTLPGEFQPRATLPETREDRAKKLRKPSATSSAVASMKKPSATSSAVASTEKPVVTTDLVPHGQKFAVIIPPRPVPTARKPFSSPAVTGSPTAGDRRPPADGSGSSTALVRRSPRF